MKKAVFFVAICLLGPILGQMIITVDRTAPLDVQWAWALYQGDVDWVTELIAKGSKVNKKLGPVTHHQSGTTLPGAGEYPIQVAVRGGGSDLIEYLAQKGANLGVKNSEGQSLIHLAYDRPRALAALLKLKLNPAAQDKKGNTVLHLAIGDGVKLYEEQEAVVRLLKENKRLLSLKNRAGLTVIQTAMLHHNRHAIEVLAPDRLAELDNKIAAAHAKVEADQKKKTEAYSGIDLSICKQPARMTASDVLIKAVNTNDRKLFDCVMKKKPVLANYRSCVNEYAGCETKPHVVFEFNREELIDAMIDASSKEYLDADSHLGNTATALLFQSSGRASWFKKLKAKGVRLNVANKYGRTPQALACEKSNDDVVKILGADSSGGFKVGEKVWIQGLSEATVVRACSHGAIVSDHGQKSFTQANLIRREPQAFLTQKTQQSAARENEIDPVAERKRDKSKDIRAGAIVRVKSTSFKEKTSEPSMHAVCEAKTVLRRMPDGYYRGSIHCGGSAYYTFNVGADIEEIKDKPPAEQSHNVRRCIERCLEKCGRPALGKEPSYGNTVCTQGCQPSCESTWGSN